MAGASVAVRHFINRLLLVVFWLVVFLSFPLLCRGAHDHDHDEHDHHHHHHHSRDEAPAFKYSRAANNPYTDDIPKQDSVHAKNSWTVWCEALGSTLLISAAPFFILFFVPLDKSKEKEPLLKILLSFASGGLLGDAFLHLIPHALMPHSHGESGGDGHDHGHSHGESGGHGHDMGVGICVLLGIVTFLLVEKSVRLLKGGHGHSHSAVQAKEEKVASPSSKTDKGSKKKKEQEKKKPAPAEDKIAVAGYLNLAADFTHNLTDGLAIGASYLAGQHVGIITTVTILLHEVPHEIGDFAILIQSGCSRRKAMGLQLITALGAIVGTLISLLAEGAGDVATSWILPFTAGGFIYISTVSIIPELLEDSKFFQSVKEIFAMLVGVALMVVIAEFE